MLVTVSHSRRCRQSYFWVFGAFFRATKKVTTTFCTLTLFSISLWNHIEGLSKYFLRYCAGHQALSIRTYKDGKWSVRSGTPTDTESSINLKIALSLDGSFLMTLTTFPNSKADINHNWSSGMPILQLFGVLFLQRSPILSVMCARL